MSDNFSGYDLIGDLHGHAEELQLLLEGLGYQLDDEQQTYYCYPDGTRRVIFVGDLIDRGPMIRETVQIVRSMVEAGQALCVMGNHEYNAIQFWHQPPTRSHSIKNINQHSATVKAFQNHEEEWEDHLAWFRTLPVYLDIPGLRVVHATWNPKISELSRVLDVSTNTILPIYWYSNRQSERSVIEETLKGQEMDLPEGCNFSDKDGNRRIRARTKWWLNPSGLTYNEYLESYAADCAPSDLFVDPSTIESEGYPIDEKPIFFGHYWLRGEPQLQAPNVCCLDYSVAKGGNLVTYRWSGESVLSEDNFVYV